MVTTRLEITNTLWCASVVLLTASAAAAQQSSPPAPPLPPPSAGSPNLPWHPPHLVPLEQGVEDRSSLDASLRIQQVDLSVPGGFRQVYHVPGRDDLLMRVNGGMYAVFPESYYRRGRGGISALIPPGTVFYIGEPPINRPIVPGASGDGPAAPPPPRSQIDPRINAKWNRRVQAMDAGVVRTDAEVDPNAPPGFREGDLDLPSQPMPAPRIPRSSAPTIRTVATDEGFRMRRLGALLDRAMAAASQSP